MGIAVVRKNGVIIEMPEGAARFHRDLQRTGAAKAVDSHNGRTYEVRLQDGDMHFHEQSAPTLSPTSSVLIRSPKLPMNK